MDKKTKTIIIVVVAIMVVGGLYYGVNRWRQQRMVNQYLKSVYGVDAGKFGSGISSQLAQELTKEAARQEAQDKIDEAKEAAKTPEDRFNETKPVVLTGASATVVKDVVEPRLATVFGKSKPTLFSGNYMGQGSSFLVVFKLPKVPTSEDFNKLIEEFAKIGFINTGMSSVSADSSMAVLEKNGSTISVSYENPEDQEIGVLYVGASNQ